MKSFFAAAALLFLIIPSIGYADGYVVVNYGLGGSISEPSLGVELGGLFLSDLHPNRGAISFGIAASAADTDEDPPSALPQPVSPPAYSSLTEYKDGYEQEIGFVLGAELTTSLFGVIGIGYSTQDTVRIGTDSGQYYKVDEDTDNHATAMIGLRYVVRGLNLGLGIHSRRGIMASAGIAF